MARKTGRGGGGGLEIVSPEGLRLDGRRPLELRHFSSSMGVFSKADGSALVKQGNTHVMASIYGPREPGSKAQAAHDHAVIHVDFTFASFSVGERKLTSGSGKRDPRLLELGILLKQTFEPVLSLSNYPGSVISIAIHVLQHDGGALSAAINATALALIDAGIPMSDYICACAAGIVDTNAILDLNLMEENADVPHLTIAILPKSGAVMTMHLESKFPMEHFEQVIELASKGCQEVYKQLDTTVRQTTAYRFRINQME